MGLFIEEFSPSRGSRFVSNDKRARVHSVAPLLFDKVVWAPDRRWAREVMNECAEFPNGDHDDYADCVTMALTRFRTGNFIKLSNDAKEDGLLVKYGRPKEYY